jgi:MFS family permease
VDELMSDLVPPTSRGRYFAQRNTLAGIVAMVAPLPASAFLDQAVKYDRFDPRLAFAALFAIACVAAVGAFVLIRRQPEPPRAPRPAGEAPANPFRSLAAPLANPNFRRFLAFSGALTVSQGLAGQFFVAWQVGREGLNLPYLTVQILGAVASGAGLATTVAWGYLADKYGSRPVLMLGTAGAIIAPFVWLLTTPGPEHFWTNVALIVFINFCSGAFWAGIGLTQFNLMLSSAEAASQATYVAVFAAFTGVLGGIAPVVGGTLMELLAPVSIRSARSSSITTRSCSS